MAEDKRIDWIDIAKGGSIALVLVYHVIYVLREYQIAHYGYIEFNDFFEPVRMPLFFAISGFFAKSIMTKSWHTLLNQKIMLFIYLLVIWTFIRWVYYGYFIENITRPEEGQSLLQIIISLYMPVGQLWFIWALAIFFTVTKIFKDIKPVYVISFFTIISILTFADYIHFDYFAHRNIMWYFPFFLLGYYFSKERLSSLEQRLPLIGIISFIAFLAFYLSKDFFTGMPYGIIIFATCCCGILWALYLAFLTSKVSLLRDIFLYFGRNTLPIYLIHSLFVSLFSVIIVTYLNAPIAIYAGVPICILFTIISTIIVDKIIRSIKADRWLYQLPNFLQINSKK